MRRVGGLGFRLLLVSVGALVVCPEHPCLIQKAMPKDTGDLS